MAIPLKLRSNGGLIKQLQERRAKWVSSSIAVRLTVPPELFWWYLQEFGTASAGDKGGVPYSIDPVDSELLAYPGPDGKTVFAHHVNHPGIKPRRMVTKVLPQIREAIARRATEALKDGATQDPAVMLQAMLAAVGDAKELIVESIAQNLPGTRPVNTQFPKQGGKLGGRTAASVFEENATVVDVSK